MFTCEDREVDCAHCAGGCTREWEMILFPIPEGRGVLFCEPCGFRVLEDGTYRPPRWQGLTSFWAHLRTGGMEMVD